MNTVATDFNTVYCSLKYRSKVNWN